MARKWETERGCTVMNISTTLLTASAGQTEPHIALVVAMGVGIVFVGLVSLIAVCKITSFFCGLGNKKEAVAKAPEAAPAPANTEIPDRKQFIAAVSAVIAEELGTDVSAIRIRSVKRI